MTEQPKKRPWLSWLVSIVGVLAVFAVASLMYVGAETAPFTPPDIAADILQEINRLNLEYAAVSKQLAGYRDIWGTVSIALGAVVTVLTTLRAPQLLIVGSGAMLAVVLGNMQLNVPQKKIEALTKAQQSMTCLTVPYSITQQAKDAHYDRADWLSVTVANDIPAMTDYRNKVDGHSDKLAYWLNFNESEAMLAAKNKVTQALVTAVPGFESATDRLDEYDDELSDLYSIVRELTWDLPYEFKQEVIVGIRELEDRVETTEEIFETPNILLREIRSEYASTQNALIEGQSQIAENRRLVLGFDTMLNRMPEVSATLAGWTNNIDAVEQRIANSVIKVHEQLLADLARTGATAADIAAIVQPVQDSDILPPMSDLAEDMMPEPIYSEAEPAGASIEKSVILSEEQQQRLQRARELVSKAQADFELVLKDIDQDLRQARELIAYFQSVQDVPLAVIQQYTRVLSDDMRTIQRLHDNNRILKNRATANLSAAETIVNSINFDSLNLQINSCFT